MAVPPVTSFNTTTLLNKLPTRRRHWFRNSNHKATTEERGLISPIEKRSPAVRMLYIAMFLLVILILVTILFPIYWLFTGALKSLVEIAQNPPTLWPVHPDWSNFSYVWNAIDWPKTFMATLLLAIGGWLLNTFVSATAAYSFSQLRPRFGTVLLFVYMCTLMIPSIVLIIPQYANIIDVPLFHWNLINTPFAIWFQGAFGAWGIFIYKLFFDQVPQDLIDCARVEGAQQWTIFWKLCLPLVRPAIIVGLITSFIADWTAFFWPLLTLQGSWWQPVGLVLYLDVAPMNTARQIAGGVIGAIVPFILVAVFQKQIIKSNAAFAGIKG